MKKFTSFVSLIVTVAPVVYKAYQWYKEQNTSMPIPETLLDRLWE